MDLLQQKAANYDAVPSEVDTAQLKIPETFPRQLKIDGGNEWKGEFKERAPFYS